MPKRAFGPNGQRVDFLIDRLSNLRSDQARSIAAEMDRVDPRRQMMARRNALRSAQVHGRSSDWGAGRAYGSSAVDHAAYNAEGIHYSAISRGHTYWLSTRRACRDAAAVAAISYFLDPEIAEILAGPVVRACPSLRPLILG